MHELNQMDVAGLLASGLLSDVDYHTSLASTQDRAQWRAAQDANAGKELPCLILADEQTAGRGRGANLWWTAPGSLAVSLLFDPGCFGLPKRPLPQASLAAGVAVIDAVSPWAAQQMLGLHWPNDVFAANRKLSGILIDVLPDGRHILGIGLNVNNRFADAPEEVRSRATSLIELHGDALNRTDVLLAVLEALASSFRALAGNPQQFGERFDELCIQIGHDVTIVSAGRRTTGRCVGIDHDGALLLETLSGLEKIYSGARV